MKINLDPNDRITLYSTVFDEMRHTLDKTLQGTLRQMIRKDMSAGAVGLKIDISLEKTVTRDDNAPSGERPALRPEIAWKVSFVMQQKADGKGDAVTDKDGKEVLVGDDGEAYLVSEEEASGQLSMFNSWDEFREAAMEGQPAQIDDDEEMEDENDADV